MIVIDIWMDHNNCLISLKLIVPFRNTSHRLCVCFFSIPSWPGLSIRGSIKPHIQRRRTIGSVAECEQVFWIIKYLASAHLFYSTELNRNSFKLLQFQLIHKQFCPSVFVVFGRSQQIIQMRVTAKNTTLFDALGNQCSIVRSMNRRMFYSGPWIRPPRIVHRIHFGK